MLAEKTVDHAGILSLANRADRAASIQWPRPGPDRGGIGLAFAAALLANRIVGFGLPVVPRDHLGRALGGVPELRGLRIRAEVDERMAGAASQRSVRKPFYVMHLPLTDLVGALDGN